MDTIIRIKKNKPAYRALIQLARELKKADSEAIFINESSADVRNNELIEPKKDAPSPFIFFGDLSDIPTIEDIRKHACAGSRNNVDSRRKKVETPISSTNLHNKSHLQFFIAFNRCY